MTVKELKAFIDKSLSAGEISSDAKVVFIDDWCDEQKIEGIKVDSGKVYLLEIDFPLD